MSQLTNDQLFAKYATETREAVIAMIAAELERRGL